MRTCRSPTYRRRPAATCSRASCGASWSSVLARPRPTLSREPTSRAQARPQSGAVRLRLLRPARRGQVGAADVEHALTTLAGDLAGYKAPRARRPLPRAVHAVWYVHLPSQRRLRRDDARQGGAVVRRASGGTRPLLRTLHREGDGRRVREAGADARCALAARAARRLRANGHARRVRSSRRPLVEGPRRRARERSEARSGAACWRVGDRSRRGSHRDGEKARPQFGAVRLQIV